MEGRQEPVLVMEENKSQENNPKPSQAVKDWDLAPQLNAEYFIGTGEVLRRLRLHYWMSSKKGMEVGC